MSAALIWLNFESVQGFEHNQPRVQSNTLANIKMSSTKHANRKNSTIIRHCCGSPSIRLTIIAFRQVTSALTSEPSSGLADWFLSHRYFRTCFYLSPFAKVVIGGAKKWSQQPATRRESEENRRTVAGQSIKFHRHKFNEFTGACIDPTTKTIGTIKIKSRLHNFFRRNRLGRECVRRRRSRNSAPRLVDIQMCGARSRPAPDTWSHSMCKSHNLSLFFRWLVVCLRFRVPFMTSPACFSFVLLWKVSHQLENKILRDAIQPSSSMEAGDRMNEAN